ncbi:protein STRICTOSIDINE SYNTHASE-LIKE 4-like [Impatiens glandulifera]|uniref:protein STRICTOSIDINE SYNTHASE-LIKE 4-like n=1 Tax=Impatiens glandulifera TaxID=253017 RepID=UPI001FB1622C|nr:protein STRICTOSIDINE SYNTHASE-LIKE 4-like [Impatiens glandulifera]
MNNIIHSYSSFLLVVTIGSILCILLFSPISSPNIIELPHPSPLPPNNRLHRLTKVGGELRQPEDVCVDKEGTIYAATRDGWIKKFNKEDDSWENWKKFETNGLLGITATRDGSIIACDVHKGLVKFDEDGVSVLTSQVNGTKIKFADDVIEASDGSLYFSVASTKYSLHNWHLDMLEAKPHGQLLKYDPSIDETSIVIDGLGFANGVALSANEDFLVVCETWKFRCLKYWLKGNEIGKIEVFVDNLPGGPDNINLAPDGSFWIAILELISPRYEFVHTSKTAKHILAIFPSLFARVTGLHKKAMVIHVTEDGKIIDRFDDPDGTSISFLTSAVEFDNHLYLGSLNSNFVGKLSLNIIQEA